jgi:hypothetical protein
MTSKTVTSLAFAAGCVLALGAMSPANAQSYPPAQPQPYAAQPPMVDNQLVTNAPQTSRGDYGGWSARRNNIQSAQYERLLQTNPGFRQARMRKECGPIGDPQLRDQCLASFQQYEPVMTGSSAPPRQRHHRSNAGY